MFLIKQAKRQKMIIATVVSVVMMLVLTRSTVIDIFSAYVSIYLILIIAFSIIGLLIWWVIGDENSLKQLPSSLLPIYTYLMLLYVILTPLQQGILYAVGIFGGVFFYILLLTTNILFVSQLKQIPLKRAGLSTLFLFNMIQSGVLIYLTMKHGWGMDAQTLGVWLLIIGLAYSYLHKLNAGSLWIELGVFAVVTLELISVINFWPAGLFVSTVALTGWVFIILGLFQSYLQKELTIKASREYAVVSLLLLLVYLFI